MARKPRARSRRSDEAKAEHHEAASNGGGRPKLARVGTDRGKIIEAFMELLAEQSYEEIGLADVAARAAVSLPVLRDHFGSTLEILAAHIKDVDREVLAGHDQDMTEEPARERLFDVLMRRFEVLTPYKDAIRSLLRSAQTDPLLALALNGLAIRSQQWMLTAADIGASGPRGLLRAQGLALLYGRVLSTFINDDEPGNARTMAALDRALARGQRWCGVFDNLCRFVPGCSSRWRSRFRTRHDEDGEEPVAV
jgi:AcrR family transcriptional regulator